MPETHSSGWVAPRHHEEIGGFEIMLQWHDWEDVVVAIVFSFSK